MTAISIDNFLISSQKNRCLIGKESYLSKNCDIWSKDFNKRMNWLIPILETIVQFIENVLTIRNGNCKCSVFSLTVFLF